MSDVSCKAFDIFVAALAAKGLSLDVMVAGIGITVEQARDKRERITWAQWCAAQRNVRPHFTDDEYRELGRSYMRAPGLRFAFLIARLVFTPLNFYRWFSKPREGLGNQVFACVVPYHREISKHEIELDLTLPDGYEVCWDWFLISSGNMEELPRLFGLPRAKVELIRIPRGGRMRISLPEIRIPVLQRVWRALTWPFTARAAGRELKEAHEALAGRFAELQDARITLDRQATQLRTAHTISELAQRSLDVAVALETITKALVEQAGFVAATLTLGDGSRTASVGTPSGDQLERTLAGRAGQVIATLTVTPAPGADRQEREELLDFIVPGLAIALENAIYRSELERLVDARTAELRDALATVATTVDQLREVQGARERFFGNISHEIRTPLSIITLATSDLEARFGDQLDARAKSRFGVIVDATRKLLRLVDELLLLAAGQEGKLATHPEPTDLVALVRLLEDAWRPVAERAGHTLVTRVPAALHANVDPVAIERVLTNLLSNAVKYTPAGGELELELALEDGIRMSVFDTGSGIDVDLASRLFGRFERGATRGVGGTGLGLSLAKQLVEAHRGTISAHGRARGSELRIMLPAELVLADQIEVSPARLVDAPLDLPRPEGEGGRYTPPGLSRGTILLAEDDARLADMMATLLADEFTVLVAHDGRTALELLRRHQPQLLVTDIDMPGIDGIELARLFREHTGERLAPIIIVSAVLDLGTRVAGLEAGATDYVCKPFDPAELRARVRAQFRTRELALRLHRAEQLSGLGILTAGLAHELRNPANGIVNAIAPIRERLPAELVRPDHPVGQLFEVVAECAAQVNHLVRQLLGFREGSSELERRPIAVRELLDRAAALTRDVRAGMRYEVVLPPGDPVLDCAPPLLLQALINLIENAAHAAGRDGSVGLVVTAGERLVIEVQDSGAGVPAELRERVFEPFFTTKPVGKGTGLGLALARDIVHRHGGTLEIRERGAGTAFVIELPLRQPLAAAS